MCHWVRASSNCCSWRSSDLIYRRVAIIESYALLVPLPILPLVMMSPALICQRRSAIGAKHKSKSGSPKLKVYRLYYQCIDCILSLMHRFAGSIALRRQSHQTHGWDLAYEYLVHSCSHKTAPACPYRRFGRPRYHF